ncbi:MAG: thiamine phosphate synthase [Candidatus Caldatribacteriaceae bacterium]
MDLSLYVITDRKIQAPRSHVEVVQEVIAAGASVVQLREKEENTRTFLEEALSLRAITKEQGVLFIVNDRIDVALAACADGVHLGEEDMPIEYVRRIAPHLLIGASCDTEERAKELEAQGADYLGVGTVFATATKKDAGEPIGLERLRAIKKVVKIPVVAIGGITLENLEEVLATGVDGIAVISAIVGSPSPYDVTRMFRRRIDLWRGRAQ